MLASHYAPRATVRLDAKEIRPGEAALLFGSAAPAGLADAPAQMNLSSTGSLAEAAANLFSALRRLDATGRRDDRRHADSRNGPRRSDQRPPPPRRGRAVRTGGS